MGVLEILYGRLDVFPGVCWVDRAWYVAYIVVEFNIISKAVDVASFYIRRKDVARLGV